jgi:hypothetical protein
LAELFKSLEWKVTILEGEVKMSLEKLIGLHYNMDDHKDLVAKAQEGFDVIQSRLKGPIKKVESFKKQVLGVFLFLFTL